MDDKINYSGQELHADPAVDVVKVEKEHRDQARAKANADPQADIDSAAESASGDQNPEATLMD